MVFWLGLCNLLNIEKSSQAGVTTTGSDIDATRAAGQVCSEGRLTLSVPVESQKSLGVHATISALKTGPYPIAQDYENLGSR